jgi:hypothetical protein
MREGLIVSARNNYIVKDGYGKNASTDKVAIATTAGVTKATVVAGGEAKIGDCLYVLPYLVSGSAVTAPSINNKVSMKIRYPKTQKGSVVKNFEYTFASAPATLADAVTELNSELTRVGLSEFIEFKIVPTNKIMIQAKKLMTSFGVNATSTFDMKLPLLAGKDSTWGHQIVFTLSENLTALGTEVTLSAYHETIRDSVYALTSANYMIFKNMGESTSSSLKVDDSSTVYSGNSYMAKQVEYIEGSISFTIEEQEFLFDNLEMIKAWSKAENPVSPYGKTMTESYTLKGTSVPKDFSLISFGHDVNGVLSTLFLERAKSQNLTVALEKTNFRTYSETITPLTPDNKIVVLMGYQL